MITYGLSASLTSIVAVAGANVPSVTVGATYFESVSVTIAKIMPSAKGGGIAGAIGSIKLS